ncbi:MAG: T9SS type A sorting domain-containing protein, partial [Bacteroidota bacterium]
TEQDQLDVEVSTDCGATWNNVFSKAGAALSTKAAQTAAFVPTSAQWRKETITLTGYNSPNVLVRFVATSDYGNNMYIDNVNIASCVPPTTSLTASSNSICSGQSATLTASGASSYTWNTGSNNSTVSVNPSATTVYTLTASNQPGCTGTNTIQLVVSACAGILNGLSDQDVSVFPNPASSMVVLSIAKTAVYDLELVNVLGQTVLAQSIQGTAQFDISALKSGVYTLQLKQHNESVYRTQLIRQ